MKLGTEVGLGPGNIAIDTDSAHHLRRDIACKAVAGLATFSAGIVIYLMLIRCAGT